MEVFNFIVTSLQNGLVMTCLKNHTLGYTEQYQKTKHPPCT